MKPKFFCITIKEQTTRFEKHIYSIGKTTHQELIEYALQEYNGNFTGRIGVKNIKIYLKNGKLHNRHNSPAVKDGKRIRLFCENGKLKSHRTHDSGYAGINVALTIANDIDITLNDLFSKLCNTVDITDYVDTLSDVTLVIHRKENLIYYKRTGKKFYQVSAIEQFLEESNADFLTDELWNIFTFEQELKNK